MTRLALVVGALAATLLTTPLLAQTTAPATTPAKPAVVTAPAAKPAPAPAPVAAPAATPATQKVNLNTAGPTELDALPQIGPARSKAIIEARTKAKFKSWDDFVARSVIPANAEAAIKDLVVVR